MLVAFNWSLKKSQPKVEGWHEEWVPDTETWPKYELDDGPLTDEQYEKIQEEANKSWSVGPPPEWPEDDNRSDIIGQNGNDGIHYDEVPTAPPPPPPPPPKEPSLGANINEYDSPSKTIEQEVDDLNQKPLNSLDRLKRKYGNPDS
jgi:hypothetical protein